MSKISFPRIPIPMLVVVVSVAIIGSVVFMHSYAATLSTAFEPEDGTVSGNAQSATISDPTASGGKVVTFGNALHPSLKTPIRAAFYYPWYPETWTVNGSHVFYNPSLGYYDSSIATNIDTHIQAMQYAKIQVAIASWWGPGTHNESTRIPLLLNETQALSTGLKWALYYEQEGTSDPTASQIQSDLQYIKTNYADSPSYAYVNNKPVIFVYGANDTTCDVADRWAQANATEGFYVDLKVFSGYKTCTNQPDSWHQYNPAVVEDKQTGYSFSISPGFWRADEATPRLARDPTRWATNVTDMVTANTPWQLITTFNEWGEGTATESAQEWSTSSTYGTYLDTLHNN